MNYQEIIKSKLLSQEELLEIKEGRNGCRSSANVMAVLFAILSFLAITFFKHELSKLILGFNIHISISESIPNLVSNLIFSAFFGLLGFFIGGLVGFFIYLKPKIVIPNNSLGFVLKILEEFYPTRSEATGIIENKFVGKVLLPGRYDSFYVQEIHVFENKEYSFLIENQIPLPFHKGSLQIELQILIYYRITDPIIYLSYSEEDIKTKLLIKATEFVTFKIHEDGFEERKISKLSLELKQWFEELKLPLIDNIGIFIGDIVLQKLSVEGNNEQRKQLNLYKPSKLDKIKSKVLNNDERQKLFLAIHNTFKLHLEDLQNFSSKKKNKISIEMIQNEFILSDAKFEDLINSIYPD